MTDEASPPLSSSHRATQLLKLPEAPVPSAFPASCPLRPQLLSLSPSSQVQSAGDSVLVGNRRRGCLRVWLFPPSSLLPSSPCLSGCFLCQPGSAPASPLLWQAAAVLSHMGLLWAVAFQSVSINAFCPTGGVCRAPLSGRGHIASSFLHCLKPTSPGKAGYGPLHSCLLLCVGPWAHPFSPLGLGFLGEPRANAQGHIACLVFIW